MTQRVSMIAAKRVKYPHGPDGREYRAGEDFEALSERDAKGLYVSGAARYAAPFEKKARSVVDIPKRAVKAVEPEVAEEPAPLSGTYLRRDMQAVGQTGEDKPVQSSRRGRPRKVWNSPDSEDDAG
jgi:hypothetical protein